MTIARRHLGAAEPVFAPLIKRIGPCRLKTEPAREPFEALLRAVAHQQLHARAAEAILGRFIALYQGGGFPKPEQILLTDVMALKGCGWSENKIAAIHDLCRKALDGIVPTRRAAMRLDDEALIERLTTVRGIGRWTVEMLLIFNLGRPDILPVDDFGVQEGYRILHGLETRPKPKALAQLGLPWSPFRSTAAWYLWRAADEGKKIPYKAS
ncbi:DNA-3-methyladenine glycosylase family protein [Acidisoma sp.]|uniref:DNA-3-methyladenine glycosylase family protein n=1 Tax=Acidisoma sp. TaxID=1872115 RepID=UPI003AFFEAE5